MTLQASIKALRDDAGEWKGVSDTTKAAAQAASGMTLSTKDLSWASEETGVLASYEEIRAKAEMLLNEATTILDNLSTTLNDVASAYEQSDEKATQRFKGVWDPHR
jgi:uncharacterized protein YukE